MKENDRKVVSTDHRAYGELHGTLCMTEKDRGKYPVFLFHGDIKLVLQECHQCGGSVQLYMQLVFPNPCTIKNSAKKIRTFIINVVNKYAGKGPSIKLS